MIIEYIAPILFLIAITRGQPGCTTSANFTNKCTTLKGVVDGGRCLFLSSTATLKWTDAFSYCRGYDAYLAVIYTESEMTKIQNQLLHNQAGTSAFIALKNTKLATGKAMDDSYTQVYDENGSAVTNSIIKISNTFMRPHAGEDTMPGTDSSAGSDATCIMAYMSGNLGRLAFGDGFCTKPRFALCVITNTEQTFQLQQSKCFTSPIVQSYPSTTLDQCMANCASSAWCHTYSHYTGTGNCDLFAIAAQDASAGLQSAVSSTCLSYTYVA